MKKYIGFDMGGSNLRSGIMDTETGKILASQKTETEAEKGKDVVTGRMVDLIKKVIEDSGITKKDIGAIGIGVPGLLDLEKGHTLFLPNLPGNWPDVPLADIISRELGLPVYLLNDVRAITYGEYKKGAGAGVKDMACFAVGTGIGGGLILDGKLHLGLGGTAGELGHIVIDFNGPRCGCGNYGCVEAYASGPAIAAMGFKAVTQGLTTNIGNMAGFDHNKIDASLIADAALSGDGIAKDIYNRAGFYLGIAIANVLVTASVQRVVIGGGVSAAGDLLLDPIKKTLKERVSIVPIDEVEVVLASLGSDAGLVGTAMWARDHEMK